MGNFIKVIVQFTAFVAFMGAIIWFIMFNMDVYNVCVDSKIHPKTELICKPFGFTVKKPEPERKFRDGKF